MQVDIAFPTQMTKKGSTKAMVDGILMRVSWKVTHGSDQASWCGAESVQNIDQSTDLREIAEILLKVALNTINQTKHNFKLYYR